ncbi:MAG: FHA domain-containing protein, partial [Actinomycetota bacterium]|nr:FHA domain-containing protein [Actinomycetota bacterium]
MTASLWIVVDGEPLWLLAAPNGTVSELAEALGRDPVRPLWIDGRRSEPAETLACAGLVQGSSVSEHGGTEVGDSARPSGDNRATPALRCVAGPDAGSVLALTPGRHLVGRAVDASLRLDDPLLEPYAALVDVDHSGQVTFTQLTGRATATVAGGHDPGPTVIVAGQSIELGSSRLEVDDTAVEASVISTSASEVNPWYRVVHRRVRTLSSWSPAPISPPVEPVPRTAGSEAHLGWIATVFALAGGVVIAVVMGSMLFLVFGAFAAAGAVAVSTARWLSRRRRSGRDAARHAEAMTAFDAAVGAQRQGFVDHHRDTLTTVPDILVTALEHRAALWERRSVHTDAHVVTMGWGAVEWGPTLAASSGCRPEAGSPWERPYVIADMLT